MNLMCNKVHPPPAVYPTPGKDNELRSMRDMHTPEMAGAQGHESETRRMTQGGGVGEFDRLDREHDIR